MMQELHVRFHFLIVESNIVVALKQEIMIHLGATINVDLDIGIIVAIAR